MKKLLLIVLIIIAGLVIYFLRGSKVTDNIDSYIYELPFQKGEAFKVVQGYGGLFSHKYKAALDFNLPEGSPVYAAREGMLYSYQDENSGGGLFVSEKKANYVIIKHSDGSYGCYWHLKHKGVVVKKGMVKKGELIGYSGSTGFVLQAHLHFAVKRKLNYDKNSFVQTKFRTNKGIVILSSGKTYVRPSD